MQHTKPDYESKFSSWERRSSVRTKPRRQLEKPDGALFFPPELVPVVQHPLIIKRGEEDIRHILLQRLHLYLDFTAELEQLAVNPVVQRISRRKMGIELPDEMVADAYKICTDESWHAQFTDDLQRQIVQATGVHSPVCGEPFFLRRLREIAHDLPPELSDLSSLFFTVISETLISSILSHIPRDRRIFPAVRQTVADHAEDEGRHHAYFTKVFEYVWPRLEAGQRAAIGPLLPEFIIAFLKPDDHAMTALLATHGLTHEEILGIIEESHPESEVRRTVRLAAHSGLRLFERHGVYDDPRTHEAFAELGLLDVDTESISHTKWTTL